MMCGFEKPSHGDRGHMKEVSNAEALDVPGSAEAHEEEYAPLTCAVCGCAPHDDPCEKCGRIVHVGDFPFCPHAPLDGGMLGEFHEYTDPIHFATPIHFTSLAQRNRVEREH